MKDWRNVLSTNDDANFLLKNGAFKFLVHTEETKPYPAIYIAKMVFDLKVNHKEELCQELLDEASTVWETEPWGKLEQLSTSTLVLLNYDAKIGLTKIISETISCLFLKPSIASSLIEFHYRNTYQSLS